MISIRCVLQTEGHLLGDYLFVHKKKVKYEEEKEPKSLIGRHIDDILNNLDGNPVSYLFKMEITKDEILFSRLADLSTSSQVTT